MPETDSILATLEENAVLETLNEYAVAYCAKDLDRLMAVFDDCEDISLIGTGADELCAGRSEVAAVFQRNFEEATLPRRSPFTFSSRMKKIRCRFVGRSLW
jgi:hypothetical protein